VAHHNHLNPVGLQQSRRVDQRFEHVGAPKRPDEADGEGAGPDRGAHDVRRSAVAAPVEVDAVGQVVKLRRVHAARPHVPGCGRQHRHDDVSASITEILQPLHEQHEGMACRQPAELAQGQRPDVAHLEGEPGAEPPRPARGDGQRKQRRRGDEDRVRARQLGDRQPQQAQREGGHVEDPSEADRALVARPVHPAVGDAVDRLERELLRDLGRAGEEVRPRAGDHHHAMAPGDECPRQVVMAVLHAMPRGARVLVDDPDDPTGLACVHAGASLTRHATP
jgi:hypothetical protein